MNWNDDNADAAAKDAYCKVDGHNAQLKCKWFRKTVAERVEWCKKGTGEREAMDANCGPYQ